MIERRRRPFLIRYAREAYFTLANPVQAAYWRIARPQTRGVKALVTHDGKFLLVRIGYAHRKWTLPGGKVDAGEGFKDAAIRELREESGVRVDDMVHIGGYESEAQGKQDTVQCFAAESSESMLVIDDQEIIDAGWFSRESLPEHRVSRVDEIITMYDTYTREGVLR